MGTAEKKTTTRDMTEGSIVKQVLLFSLPLMLGNVFQMLYNTVDSVVVGNFVGTEALAAVGATTMKLAKFEPGQFLPAVLGPLGKPTEIHQPKDGKPGRIVCVGGGIGVAPMHPIAQALKAAGNDVTIIMGARNKDLFVMKDEMAAIAGDKLILMTDDGSSGRKGLVTEPLKELCEAGAVDEVIAIGPPIMMKFCALTTKPYGVKTIASLNTIMIDGTGMCGGCRVTVGGETKFVCVDGPEFDAHQVDWDLMLKRMGGFKPQEQAAKDHVCKSGIFSK